MEEGDQQLREFLIGNFETLPPDVIGVIAAQLDRKSLLELCLSNKKFMSLCKSSKWFDRRALDFIQERAPLSGRFRTLDEQAALIERGFKSCYHALVDISQEDPDTWLVERVWFGGETTEHSLISFRFEILGLPPPKGTKVWVLADSSNDRYSSTEIFEGDHSYVFLTKEEAIQFLRSPEGEDRFNIDLRDEIHLPDNLDYEGIIKILSEEGGIDFIFGFSDPRYFFLQEVTLP